MSTKLVYPHPRPPAARSALEVAPGVHWLRFALPFALDHINLWLLADQDNTWTLVDCGIGLAATREDWEAMFPTVLGGRPLGRIVVTHYHPDHIGQAAWLSERFGVPVLMTPGEFAAAQAAHGRSDDDDSLSQLFLRHGLDRGRAETLRASGNGYRRLVPRLPERIEPLAEGDALTIGGSVWRVLIGRGHAPEHACLYNAERGLLIAGDQILPSISSNVMLRPGIEEQDPLAEFIASLDRLAELPADTRVLPAHGLVFEGLRQRAAALKAHHREQLDKLLAACGEPQAAADCLQLLFNRKLDPHSLMFAMGESAAHLHHLYRQGELRREQGSDGVDRYVA